MIYILYTNEQQTDAEEILHFLTKGKNLSISSSHDNYYVLHKDHQIAQDAAIILVSNTAVIDERWQDLVRDIPEEMRLIPVSSTKTSDYADADMIPKKIRDVNYIRMDGNHLENIWDSLTTETDFYDMKSRLILNKNVWYFSKCSDDFLLSDSKKINKYLQVFHMKIQAEKNPYFHDELSEIIHYLEVSLQYTKKLLRRKVNASSIVKKLCVTRSFGRSCAA